MKPVWTYPPEPTDKGHSYRQLAPTLGIGTIALYVATATKTMQAAKVNKSLQFHRRLRDFFAPVWGLPLVAVYVPVHDKIRSKGFAVAANISRRSGGALMLRNAICGTVNRIINHSPIRSTHCSEFLMCYAVRRSRQ